MYFQNWFPVVVVKASTSCNIILTKEHGPYYIENWFTLTEKSNSFKRTFPIDGEINFTNKNSYKMRENDFYHLKI